MSSDRFLESSLLYYFYLLIAEAHCLLESSLLRFLQKHIVCLLGPSPPPLFRSSSTTSSFPREILHPPYTRARRTDELTQTARDRATALVEAYVPTPATEGDLRCIEERQLRHKAGASSRSMGVSPNRCRHGFPQAFAFDPCGHKVRFGSGTRVVVYEARL